MEDNTIRNLRRHLRYGTHYLLERIRGLDFTMPDMSVSRETEGMVHGYCKTDESYTRKIFLSIGIHESDCLLDIGCGKGAVLREAVNFPFDKIAGIEYSDRFAQIAKNNFRKMNLSDRVQIFQGDATIFKDYGAYNMFYLFNPFDKEVMDKVIGRIKDAHWRKSWIIYHHPTCEEIFDKYKLKESHRLFDEATGYETIIYILE